LKRRKINDVLRSEDYTINDLAAMLIQVQSKLDRILSSLNKMINELKKEK